MPRHEPIVPSPTREPNRRFGSGAVGPFGRPGRAARRDGETPAAPDGQRSGTAPRISWPLVVLAVLAGGGAWAGAADLAAARGPEAPAPPAARPRSRPAATLPSDATAPLRPAARPPGRAGLVPPGPGPMTTDRRAASEQLARDTLAWVDDGAVTALDLVQRMEWMPWPEKQRGGRMDSAKVHALQSLVAERLLAGAERSHSPDSGAIVRMRASLRKALARDALYHEVMAAQPPPDPAAVDRIVRARFPRAPLADRPALRHLIADSLRTLAESARADEFMAGILGDVRARVDSSTFMLFADGLRAFMLQLRRGHTSVGGDVIPGEAADVLRSRLAGSLDRPLVRLPDGAVTLGEALEDLRYYSFPVASLQRQRFAIQLDGHLRAMIEGEVMAREALRRGLDRRPEVRHDLEMWTDAWRAASAGARVDPTRLPVLVAGLAARARLRFDYPALRRVNISPANMVVRRTLGFGGGMLAAPSLTPLFEWVPIWRSGFRALP